MNRIPTSIRIVLGLVSITASILFFSHPIGLFPDSRQLIMQGREQLCEFMAIQFSLLATKGDLTTMETSLQAIINRNPEIQSVAIRHHSGELLLEVGNHSERWIPPENGPSDDSQIYIPIASKDEHWGTVEICFRPTRSSGVMGYFEEPLLHVVLFVSLMGTLFYYAFLCRILVQLNPSGAVPSRVRSALDTLTQGLVILDRRRRIVLANQSFCQTLGKESKSLLGQQLDCLSWKVKQDEPATGNSETPWNEVLNTETTLRGVVMDLQVSPKMTRIFVVNAAPVFSDNGNCQGALISLEDITSLETTKRQLREAIAGLNASHDAIRRQNVELERLATTDPLTECMNRRSFFSRFEPAWKDAEDSGAPLSCIMVDIDHFKSVNDTRGHATGDEVLKAVALILRTMARPGDLVSRFGGEEFCVLLPYTTLEDARLNAERFRMKICEKTIQGLAITASLGVSELSLGAPDPAHLLDQADQGLYAAKEGGRNQVVCWNPSLAEKKPAETAKREERRAAKPASRSRSSSGQRQMKRNSLRPADVTP